jgi:hypothetical protein
MSVRTVRSIDWRRWMRSRCRARRGSWREGSAGVGLGGIRLVLGGRGPMGVDYESWLQRDHLMALGCGCFGGLLVGRRRTTRGSDGEEQKADEGGASNGGSAGYCHV